MKRMYKPKEENKKKMDKFSKRIENGEFDELIKKRNGILGKR